MYLSLSHLIISSSPVSSFTTGISKEIDRSIWLITHVSCLVNVGVKSKNALRNWKICRNRAINTHQKHALQSKELHFWCLNQIWIIESFCSRKYFNRFYCGYRHFCLTHCHNIVESRQSNPLLMKIEIYSRSKSDPIVESFSKICFFRKSTSKINVFVWESPENKLASKHFTFIVIYLCSSAKVGWMQTNTSVLHPLRVTAVNTFMFIDIRSNQEFLKNQIAMSLLVKLLPLCF